MTVLKYNKKAPHLVQYQGSKRNLAPIILKYFPPDINRLIEPFAGTAAISIACAVNGLTKRYIINDLNKSLSDLLKMIVDDPYEVANFYEKIWRGQISNNLTHYYKIRDAFNKNADPRLFLYLLARCVKGSVRYNADGLFNQSPDNRRMGTRPKTMRHNIISISYLLKGKAIFKSVDYRNILKIARVGDLVYMDPPYQGVCGERDSRYFSGVDFDTFVAAIEELNQRKIDFIISYDGRCGSKAYGMKLPARLNLRHIEIFAGRSTQATLLGKKDETIESLYISPSLVNKLDKGNKNRLLKKELQLTLV